MDFSIPEPVREIVRTVRSFLDREVVPLERPVFARGFGAAVSELDRKCSAYNQHSIESLEDPGETRPGVKGELPTS